MLRSVNMDNLLMENCKVTLEMNNENGKLTRVNPLKEDLEGLCKNSIENLSIYSI